MEKHNPTLVLQFGRSAKKESSEEDIQKEALLAAAKSVREAIKLDDDEKLSMALWDFWELCESTEDPKSEEY